MPAKAHVRKAVIAKAQERVKPESESCFPYNVKRDLVSSSRGVIVAIDNLPFPKGLSAQDATALKSLQKRESKIVPKVQALLRESKYEEVISCTSSVVLAKQQFGEKCSHSEFVIFNSNNIEIYQARASAYFELKQYQLCVDEANAALELISAIFAHLGTKNEKEKDTIFAVKRWQSVLLFYRANGSKGLGDKDGALIDLRAVIARVHESGRDLDYRLQANILTLMAEMKLGSPRPHYTDAEIRAWNKELQLKEYAPKNRICANCGKPDDPSEGLALKMCGGCKRVWYCGSECSRANWPIHKVPCKNPGKKRVTVISNEMACEVKANIVEVGHHSVFDDNGPALILQDHRTGRYFESLSDQDVFFVVNADDPAAVQREVLHQMSLWVEPSTTDDEC
jgi:tetratricopeptide (TPR) repeat protein